MPTTKSTIKDKFPSLTHFFTCYFHEDMMLEVQDAESAINSYLKDESPSSIVETINELENLLKIEYSEEKFTGILHELGCRYNPVFQNMSNIEWLEWIQNLLNIPTREIISHLQDKSMIKDKFPALTHFLSAYFHQDWDMGDADAEAVIYRYIQSEPNSPFQEVLHEIEQLLTMNMNNKQLSDVLVYELGCYYDPCIQKMSVVEWLQWVQNVIKKIIK